MFSSAAIIAALASAVGARPAANAAVSATGAITSAAVSSLITISSVSTSGTGCPDGSVSTIFSTDRSVVTFGFNQFTAYIGPGTNPDDHSKNCVMTVNLVYPSSYRFSVAETTFHGFADLDLLVKATFDTRISFSYAKDQVAKYVSASDSQTAGGKLASRKAAAGQAMSATSLVASGSSGEFNRLYELSGDSKVVKSACGSGTSLLANSTLTLTSTNVNASGAVYADDTTIGMQQKMRLFWEGC